ncbi:hypothetical protein DES37_103326 [Mangrovibacter plantisponsor]|jgi:hypothetical protein|uniref:Protein MgtS n=1 Tax=Mangrovibacter plantisponsor TaxID=451513 RepID=A0A317Q4K9_9ENTR|nr:hypothetical protein DES37_103326 [Mangrovibacter plantisponsor]
MSIELSYVFAAVVLFVGAGLLAACLSHKWND